MVKAFKKLALEWFERGDHDIETACMIIEGNGFTDIIAFHIHQAIEKYVKGFLVFHQKKPPRIHDLDILLNQCIAIDKGLMNFVDLCEKVTVYYIETRYPPGPLIQYKLSEIEEDMDQAKKLIQMIRSKI